VSTDQLLSILAKILNAMETLKVYGDIGITGGEPLIRKDLFQILSVAKEKWFEGYPFDIGLMTNGTLLTSDIAKQLQKYSPPLTSIQVSLDGATRETNDAIRGQGNFDRTLEGIKRIKSETTFRVIASFTVHQMNSHEVPAFVEMCRIHDIDFLQVRRMVPIGRGNQFNNHLLSPKETMDLITFLYDKRKTFTQLRKDGKHAPYISVNRPLFHLANSEEAIAVYNDGSRERLGNRCAIGFSTTTILPDGTVLPCRVLPIPVGNILKQDFIKDIWFGSELLWSFRVREKSLKGKCQHCRFAKEYADLCCGGSACVTWGVYGDYDLPDPQCWIEPSDH
jgi:MoaA/NifB/PqqE/SkfB family radical SAM enzyme